MWNITHVSYIHAHLPPISFSLLCGFVAFVWSVCRMVWFMNRFYLWRLTGNNSQSQEALGTDEKWNANTMSSIKRICKSSGLRWVLLSNSKFKIGSHPQPYTPHFNQSICGVPTHWYHCCYKWNSVAVVFFHSYSFFLYFYNRLALLNVQIWTIHSILRLSQRMLLFYSLFEWFQDKMLVPICT